MNKSDIIRRKAKLIGSDDITAVINICKWAEQSGFYGMSLAIASSVSKALEMALEFSTHNQHFEAFKKSDSIKRFLKRSETVSNILVLCRDGKKRKLINVVDWFANLQFNISEDIEFALQHEAKINTLHNIQLEAERVAINSKRISQKLKVA